MKARVYLASVNNRFGPNIHLPYSVGLLWAYARMYLDIPERYELVDFLYHKEPIADALARLDNPQVLGLSSYIWNHRWNLELANAVKKRWPFCVVIIGGPHIPNTLPADWFLKHGYIDFAVHGEGESPFALLLERLKVGTKGWVFNHQPLIPGMSFPISDGRIQTCPTATPPNPADIPSPYLTGVFDHLMARETGWQAPQETHRGCAYRCTFCEWGSSYYQKVREFPTERVEAEFQWFAKHKIEYVENCDANYGLLPRDLDMTRRMVAVKAEHGYPKRFRAAFAKNSSDRVFEISKMLYDAGMHKATTVALQSMDPQVLVNIKRKNIKDAIEPLIQRYKDAGIPTYSELILGLPGETLATFKKGVGDVLRAGQHEALFIYNMVVLPNTPFSDPAYVAEHGIEAVDMQAMLLHATPEPGAIVEIQPTVIATKAMPHRDWKRGWMFAWAIHTFHCLGLTRHVAMEYSRHGIKTYEEFYSELLDLAADMSQGSLLSHMYDLARGTLEDGLRGESWDLVDARFGPISWPPDEAAFLIAVTNLDRFYDELGAHFHPVMLREQRDLIVRPDGDLETYARELVWYGRKGVDKRTRTKAIQHA